MEIFWLFLAALYVWISILIGWYMQRLGRGGRGGWRYAVLSRIAVMTTDQVRRNYDHVPFASGHTPSPSPSQSHCPGLLTELIDVGRSHRGVGSPATSPWLFPGHLPGRPITASRLGERLRLIGVRALPGRRATLLQLAAEVPAAVLAELLHLTPGTATRWTRDAGGDWSRYAADLARRTDHQP